jgi:Fic family protein
MPLSERNTYFPAFQRYSPAATASLQRIAEAQAAIAAARILPAQEDILRRDAKVGSVHYSTLIEGNELPAIEARRAVEHELDSETKAKLELVNYVSALEWIDERRRAGTIRYEDSFVKDLHGVLTKDLGRPEGDFKPHHEGEWRDGEVRVEDALRVFHVAPPQADVEKLMLDRLEWLEDRRSDPAYFPPVLAALAHFEVAEVHPFADYNGRTARLLAVAVLAREGATGRYLFSPERYYAEDKEAYFTALRAIKTDHNLNRWLEYFLGGLADEFSRVADRVRDLNHLAGEVEAVIHLTPHQERVVAELTAGGRRDITRAEVEELTGLGKTRASHELQLLTRAGVLRPRDHGKRRSYELGPQLRPKNPNSRPRGPRSSWTDARIEQEIMELAGSVGGWPTHAAFLAAGKGALYVAASRAGGIERWRQRLWERTQKPENPQEDMAKRGG